MAKKNVDKKHSWFKKTISKDAGIFTKIIRTLLLTSALLFGGTATVLYGTPSRSLTDNEDKILQDMGYKSSIDLKDIRIHNSDTMDKFLDLQGNLAITIGNHIIVHSSNNSKDFAKEISFKKHVFKHEIGHVWQYQNCNLVTTVKVIKDKFHMFANKENTEDLYSYRLAGNRDLLDYGIEQQAELLAQLGNTNNKKYDRVLEKFRENPSYAKKNCF